MKNIFNPVAASAFIKAVNNGEFSPLEKKRNRLSARSFA
jgi:hypothetical protein